MQQDTEQRRDDATTRASLSDDKSMNDKREEARRMAEQLIAEEKDIGEPRSVLSAYMIALIIGLAIWAAIYFLWRAL
ncbi:MAG TPA: hypothetical protein VL101_06235 [Nordella sp.]|nr:hypothetical protein [Nordella sp.]